MEILLKQFRSLGMVMRYVISGGLGAITQIGTLFLYVEVVGSQEYYLLGVVLGFCSALAVTFPLQKHWTFSSQREGAIAGELMRYTTIALVSLVLNTSLMYFLVTGYQVWYLIAQVIVVSVVAMISFLLNRSWTFRVSSE